VRDIYVSEDKKGAMPIFGGAPNVEKLEARKDVSGLTGALSHKKDAAVPRAAAQALARLGEAGIDGLVSALSNSDPELRQFIVELLIGLGTEAVRPLTIALKHKDAAVRQSSALALGDIGDASAIGSPMILAATDSNPSVRDATLAAIIKIGDQAIERLIANLQHHIDEVRAATIRVLGAIGAQLENTELRGRIVDELLVNPLACSGLMVTPPRGRTVFPENTPYFMALAHIGDTRALDALAKIKFGHSRKDSISAESAFRAIARRSGTQAVQPLIQVLESKMNSGETYAGSSACVAIELLGEIGGKLVEEDLRNQVMDALAIAVQDQSSNFVRELAAEAIARIEESSAA
jgi:HEAT repeat protein